MSAPTEEHPGQHPGQHRGRHIEQPFTTRTRCLVVPPLRPPATGRPPLLVALHGQGQSGDRHARWMQPAVPPGFAAMFPDGFYVHEVRKADRKPRLGHAWYLFTGDDEIFAQSVALAEQALWSLIERVQSELGSDPTRIYLAGFSQGTYLAHILAVRSLARAAGGQVKGWIGQSGRLKHELLEAELPAVAGHRVLIQHGQDDTATPPEFAERSARFLREHGAQVELDFYPAGHVITPAMVADARRWLCAAEPDA